MTYQLWDKQSPIYNITAGQAMTNNPKYGTESSYLFYRDDGSIHDILPISEIRARANADGKTDAEACEAYIAMLTAPQEPAGDLAALSAKVAELETQLATIEAVNKTLLGVE